MRREKERKRRNAPVRPASETKSVKPIVTSDLCVREMWLVWEVRGEEEE